MSERQHVNLLRRVASIRRLQEQSAEVHAGAAMVLLRDKKEQLDTCEAQCRSTEERWRTAMTAKPFDIAISSLWSSVLVHNAQQASAASTEYATAADTRDVRMKKWNVARVLQEQADTAARDAMRRYVRKKEETRLNDVADRVSASWSRR